MRWRFHDPTDPAEAQFHEETLERIDAWWLAFAAHEKRIANVFERRDDLDIPSFMSEHFRAVHPELCWEFGRAVRGPGHRLVITPESARHLRPMVTDILARAPAIIGWELYGYRLPEDLEKAEATVQGRTGGTLQDVWATATRGDHNLIDLTFHSSRATGPEDEDALHVAFVAAESLLGEEILDQWIGAIEVAHATRSRSLRLVSPETAEATGAPLENLAPTVDALIEAIRSEQRATPWCEGSLDDVGGSLWELHPQEAQDYPGQLDLFVGRSVHEAQWLAAHSDASFFSERFSRCGETFCYVKLDGSEGLDEEKFADKAEIEDALDDALKPDGIGCCVGGGTGLRYSYIDLALRDLDEGLRRIRRRLAEGHVPTRSWILFFDDELSEEWVGVYDETPAPP